MEPVLAAWPFDIVLFSILLFGLRALTFETLDSFDAPSVNLASFLRLDPKLLFFMVFWFLYLEVGYQVPIILFHRDKMSIFHISCQTSPDLRLARPELSFSLRRHETVRTIPTVTLIPLQSPLIFYLHCSNGLDKTQTTCSHKKRIHPLEEY